MIDIALYGHLVLDEVYYGTNCYHSFGGVANIIESLRSNSQKIKIAILPTAFGIASIVLNKEDSMKKALHLNLNKIKLDVSPVNSRWSHIAYLNNLHDNSFIYDINGIKSADLSEGKLPDQNILQEIDYLFISKEEFGEESQINFLLQKLKGILVIHSPSECSIVAKGKNSFITLPNDIFVSNINVLGAGDYFCGQFISNLINISDKDPKVLENALMLAMKNTSKFLQER